MWKFRGNVFCHSILVGICELVIIGRWDASVSQIMKINIISEINDIIDPIDEITFHFMKASG